MSRVLVVAVACVLGAAGTWMFIPTGQLVGQDLGAAEKEVASAPSGKMMSEEDRRERAAQLIGDPLKYITSDGYHSASWYTEQGKQVIERAMDECYLVLEYYQRPPEPDELEDYMDSQGADDVADGAAQGLMAKFKQGSLKQLRHCKSVYEAYFAMHGRKLEF